jgi:hypothetical protein
MKMWFCIAIAIRSPALRYQLNIVLFSLKLVSLQANVASLRTAELIITFKVSVWREGIN